MVSHSCYHNRDHTKHDDPANVRLPNIRLPTFSGNFVDLDNFRDLFQAFVFNSKVSNRDFLGHFLFFLSLLFYSFYRLIKTYRIIF